MQLLIWAYHSKEVRLLETHWRSSRPDLVVSLVPNFNRALLESLRNVQPRTPFVTVLLDFVDFPPRFWIEPQEQLLICGTERAVEQAKSIGHTEDSIFRTSGMIIHPRFYEPVAADRSEERLRLGLDPERTTGLVLFGAEGSRAMLDIAKRLDHSGLPIQLILLCGHNERLARGLRELGNRIPLLVAGFTTEMPYYMHLADFMIGKPGPGAYQPEVQLGSFSTPFSRM